MNRNEEVDKKKSHLKMVKQEMLKTEEDFLKRFLDLPLAVSSLKNCASAEYDDIFNKIRSLIYHASSIYQQYQDISYNDIKFKSPAWMDFDIDNIKDIQLKINAQSLNKYLKDVAELSLAANEIINSQKYKELIEKELPKKINESISTQNNNNRKYIQELTNAIITPVQRLPRIEMLIKDMIKTSEIKNDDENHPINQVLNKTNAKILAVNQAVGEHNKKYQDSKIYNSGKDAIALLKKEIKKYLKEIAWHTHRNEAKTILSLLNEKNLEHSTDSKETWDDDFIKLNQSIRQIQNKMNEGRKKIKHTGKLNTIINVYFDNTKILEPQILSDQKEKKLEKKTENIKENLEIKEKSTLDKLKEAIARIISFLGIDIYKSPEKENIKNESLEKENHPGKNPLLHSSSNTKLLKALSVQSSKQALTEKNTSNNSIEMEISNLSQQVNQDIQGIFEIIPSVENEKDPNKQRVILTEIQNRLQIDKVRMENMKKNTTLSQQSTFKNNSSTLFHPFIFDHFDKAIKLVDNLVEENTKRMKK